MHSKKTPATHYKVLLHYAQKFSNARTKVVLSENGDHQMNYNPVTILKKY